MKLAVLTAVACVLVTSGSAGVVKKRFLLDDLTNLAHAVLDPLTGAFQDTLHTLVNEFDHLVHGHVHINTVVCKMATETTGSRADKIRACTIDCMNNAEDYLGSSASDTAAEACPIACQYAYDHPTEVTC